MNSCTHVMGFIKEGNSASLITQPMTQVNGYTEIEWFRYCPKCGKEIGHAGVMLSNEKYLNILKNGSLTK